MTRTPEPAPQDNAEIVERLRAALQPFSDALGDVAADDHATWSDDQTIEFDGFPEHITVGDLRRARAAICALATPIQGEI